MNRKVIFAFCLFALISSVAVAEQKPLEKPPEGKAFVYMGRLTGFVGS